MTKTINLSENGSIIIRKTKLNDIPTVMELLRDADFLTPNNLYDTPEYFKNSVKNGIFFVAEAEKQVIGMIHGEKLINNGAVIWYFVVNQNLRGQGIGKMLLSEFEESCRKRHVKWIFGSSDINKQTMNFYKNMGYTLSEKYIEFSKTIV